MNNIDEYFINIAKEIAKGSLDISTKVGCVIVDSKNRAVSFGYNGFITDCDKNLMTFERPYKDMITIHAEMNAVLSAKNRDFTDCKVYTTHASCENCLKHLLQLGIREFVYENFDTNGNFMTDDRIKGITILIKSTNCIYRNINGNTFFDDVEKLKKNINK